MPSTIRIAAAKDVLEWWRTSDAVIVDVRESHEYQAGHIPGAISVPLSAFDPSQVPAAANKHLVFHCHLGRRCGPASEQMSKAGFDGTIHRLEGGFVAWVDAGGPTEK